MAVPVPVPIRQDARMSLATREIKGILSSEVLNTINSPFLVGRPLCTHHVLWERNKKQLSEDNLWACLLLVHNTCRSNHLDSRAENLERLDFFEGNIVGHDDGFKRRH